VIDRPAVEDRALAALTEFAARWTGFSLDAILPDAIRRAAVALGGSGDELLLRASRRDPAVVHALCQAVSVGETFFFRHPEQFRWIAETLVPSWLEEKRARISVWSAGCATGEEAYSIAACLLDCLPRVVELTVTGTDLLERNVAAARVGEYGAWSRRPSGPQLHSLFDVENHGRLRVQDRVRAVTSFALHNLLEPAASGPYDLILCRNVLVYFSPPAIRSASQHLATAVAIGGALVLGPMDVAETPAGLVAAGPAELQVYRRPTTERAVPRVPPAPRPVPRAAPAPAPKPPPTPPTPAAPPEPVALHLRALVHIERGERTVARTALDELCARAPGYVPGLLERALLHIRSGERAAAASLMREVLRRTDELDHEELLAAPEPLPVSFYRDSAERFLRGGAP
jgi:chemotaxis protein methyltransferase CheR